MNAVLQRLDQPAPPAERLIDFLSHRHPSMAVACPTCGVRAGAWCQRPSGHRAWGAFHKERHLAADQAWYDGRYPSIIAIEGGFAYQEADTPAVLAEWRAARRQHEAAVTPAPVQHQLPL